MEKTKTSTKIISHIILIIFVLIILFPILFPLMSSFRTDYEIFEYSAPFSLHTIFPVEWTLENYISLFRDYNFSRYILNTLLVVGVILPISILMCSLAAFAFAFYNFKGKALLFALFLLTFMIPGEAIALPLYQISEKMGLVNNFWGLILPALANGLILFMFVQAFRDVHPSLLEAVKIDGGSWWASYWRVVMPLSKTIIITACLMIFVNEWNNYLWPLLVARHENVQTLTIAISKFKEENVTRWSLIYAGSMLSALVPVGLFFPFQKYFVQGIASSGVKG